MVALRGVFLGGGLTLTLKQESYNAFVQCGGDKDRDFSRALFTSRSKNEAIGDWITSHTSLLNAVCRPWYKVLRGLGYDSNDLFQEAAMVVVSAWNSYDPNKVNVKASTYFYTCVERRLISLYRMAASQKRVHVQTEYSLDEIAGIIEYSSDEADQFIDPLQPSFEYSHSDSTMSEVVEMRMEFNSIYAAMKPLHQEIVSLYMNGYQRYEIAKMLNLGIGTINYAISIFKIKDQRAEASA